MDDLLSGRKAARPRDLAAIARALGISPEALKAGLCAAQAGETGGTAPAALSSEEEILRTQGLAVQFRESRSLVREALTRHATRERKLADDADEPTSAAAETDPEAAPDGR